MVAQEGKYRLTAKDETGKRYGSLTVLERINKGGKNKAAIWLCRCDCGEILPVYGTVLRTGQRRMCDTCSKKERKEGKPGNQFTHSSRPDASESLSNYKYIDGCNTVMRIRRLRDKLEIGKTYIVDGWLPKEPDYKSKCTLIAKYPRYALFKSKRGGICFCLGYHVIMTEELVYTNELTPRRVTA